jgi:hypothetical protein
MKYKAPVRLSIKIKESASLQDLIIVLNACSLEFCRSSGNDSVFESLNNAAGILLEEVPPPTICFEQDKEHHD